MKVSRISVRLLHMYILHVMEYDIFIYTGIETWLLIVQFTLFSNRHDLLCRTRCGQCDLRSFQQLAFLFDRDFALKAHKSTLRVVIS